ncbi:translation initiation factor IF-2 [SAR86 cluster bacterium]|nr:translation initiation factor IF-2 [SAR86 cluster bacterium]
MNVSQLSKVIGYDPKSLLLQITAAGLSHKLETDEVSNEDKKILLTFLKSAKKTSKKTISLKKGSVSTSSSRKGVSITRLNQSEETTKKPSNSDFSGSIDFDAAEAKRKDAEKKVEEEKKSKSDEKQNQVVKRIKKPSPADIKAKKTFIPSKPLFRSKADSKKNKRELEGERFLETKLSNVQEFERPTEFIQKEVTIPETISVADLASQLSIKSGELIKSLMANGVMVTINQLIDQETALVVIEELGHIGVPITENEEENLIDNIVYEGKEEPRNPIVSVLGHVDHGKTSILDFIRKSSVADSEEGGITQGIGAYQVNHNDSLITFIDTPGHAAFSQMRARGANSTDIVVLVVAADDSVKPQTEEAFNHAKEAGVQIIVALNKIDLPEADIEKVKGDLSALGLVPEDWGGDTQMIPISAKTGDGMEDLLESIQLVSELMELKTNHTGPATGIVLESGVRRGEGAVATLLVQRGTLKSGDLVLVGDQSRKIRSIKNYKEEVIENAPPASPVFISGLESPPDAGDEFIVVKDEKAAKVLSENRANKMRDKRLAQKGVMNLESMFASAGEGVKPTINLILKSDTNGSLEALNGAVGNMKVDDVAIKVVMDTVGPISTNDVNLAIASEAFIYGFNVRADKSAIALAEKEGITIQYFGIIYDLIDAVKLLIEGSLDPDIKETILGKAKVKDIFRSPKFGSIAGSIVEDGTIYPNKNVRVIRDNTVVHEGMLDSLRRFKDEAKEVKSGTECGIGITNYTDIKEGDVIEVFQRDEIKRKL